MNPSRTATAEPLKNGFMREGGELGTISVYITG